MSAPTALQGVRVIELSGLYGAYCGKLFADMGADVTLFEPLTGTPMRGKAPFAVEVVYEDDSLAVVVNLLLALLGFVACILGAPPALADRIKELASIRGVAENSLVGYGLVVGLAGTGDDLQSEQTKKLLPHVRSRRDRPAEEV